MLHHAEPEPVSGRQIEVRQEGGQVTGLTVAMATHAQLHIQNISDAQMDH